MKDRIPPDLTSNQQLVDGFFRSSPEAALKMLKFKVIVALRYDRDRAEQEARRLLGELYERAMHHADTLREPKALKGWLNQIALNVAWQRGRTLGRDRLVPQGLDEDGIFAVLESAEHIPDAYERRDQLAVVMAAIAQLPERHAATIRHMLRCDLSPSKMARELGISDNAARSRWHRALKQLMATLERDKMLAGIPN